MSSTLFGQTIAWNQLKPGLAYTSPTDTNIRVVTDLAGPKRPVAKSGPYTGIFNQEVNVDVYTPIAYAKAGREVETLRFVPEDNSEDANAWADQYQVLNAYRLNNSGGLLSLKA